MCDTFVIPPQYSASGHWLFAKNSDREPNEAQQLVQIPAQHREKSTVQTSFIEVDHVRETQAMVISKPFHLWGAEMGVNASGLAIGNEAVFTRVAISKNNTGLTGMDMIRLALERCSNAKQALDQICYYVEKYGQDACGGYQNRSFYYHNSFLIADPTAAYVLETAGTHWVYRKLDHFYAISNGLSIGSAWDGISPHAISYAHTRKWLRKGQTFDFSRTYTAPLMSRLAMARERRMSCTNTAATWAKARKLTISDAIAILRSHHNGQHFSPGMLGMNNICLHATGLLTPSQTTGSMVVSLVPDQIPMVWATGSSTPCLSLFKPLSLSDEMPVDELANPPGANPDNSYWWKWEVWHRTALFRYTAAKTAFDTIALPTEKKWVDEIHAAGDGNHAQNPAIIRHAWNQSIEILGALDRQIREVPETISDIRYRMYWQRMNRRAGIFKATKP